MFNALAARCVWHCGVLLRLLLAAPLLVLACGHALRSQTACCSWLPCCAALQPRARSRFAPARGPRGA